MHVIKERNVQDALPAGMALLKQRGQLRESRAGDVLVMDGPVTTLYHIPYERVLFWQNRDANPFFHFMEGLWMIAGRDDVAWISQFSGGIAQFSDDGEKFHGAYGERWVHHYGFNQLTGVIEQLKANPDDRRCVISMWDPLVDLGRKGKDIPCNTQIYFSVGNDFFGGPSLDMTVCNRSNDIIWGCYGANAVHFSMLQEFMAGAIGVKVGHYWQMSNNYHAYVDVFEKHESLIDQGHHNPYFDGIVKPYQMMTVKHDIWLQDLRMFMEEGPIIGFRDPFFRRVVTPMYQAWFAYKNKDIDGAIEIIGQCSATDWKLACKEWLERRKK